jgi:hypothetical protein
VRRLRLPVGPCGAPFPVDVRLGGSHRAAAAGTGSRGAARGEAGELGRQSQ